MRILLINPPSENEISANIPLVVEKGRGFTPPLGLLYVASYVKRFSSHDVRVIDTLLDNLGQEQIRGYVLSYKPEVVGITALSMTMIDVMETVATIKAVNSETKVVLGGPHPHLFPEETANLPGVDFIVVGEGEVTFLELVQCLEKRKEPLDVKGLVYKKEGKTVFTGERSLNDSLDNLPFPARELVDYKKYYSSIATRTPITTMMTSRGCPYRCSFCDRPHLGKRFRARSAKNVVDEMEYCHEMGINEILFYDDTFTIDRQRVFDICDEISRRKLRLFWDIRSRVNTVDEEMLRKLSEANCKRIHFGVEAGTPKVIRALKKGITLEQVYQAFKSAKKYGISTLAYFMIGNPGETREDIMETINLSIRLNPDYALFSILVPYPGTEIYFDGLRKGIIAEDYWRQFARSPYKGFVPRYWNEFLDSEELERLVVYAYKRFYSRPRYMLKQFIKVKSMSELLRKAWTGWNVIKMKKKW